jgi:tight adherence protein B
VNILLSLSIFLGVTSALIISWVGFNWWKENYGSQRNLIDQRMGLLTARSTENDGTPSIFKEPIFSDNAEFNNILRKFKWAHSINDQIVRADVKITVHYFLVLVAGCFLAAFFGGAAMLDSFGNAFLAAILFALVPFVLIRIQFLRRKNVIERQLPDMVDYIARSMTAGHSFNSALQAAAMQSPDPLATQFKVTFEQLNFGVTLKEAMADLVKRLETEEVRFFAIAVVLNREVGGNLTELLKDVSRLMRERLTAKLVINSLTSEGKSTAKLLGCLPIVMALVLEFFNPGYFEPVLKSSAGINVYIGTAIWAIIGFVMMRSIANIRL